MADVQQLLDQFIAEDRGGSEPDPVAYLDKVSGDDRGTLEALLDAYLARAPRRSFDAAAFASSPARDVTERLARTMGGKSGAWPSLLPELRDRARLKRAEVVERLAAGLGVGGQTAQVGSYYHAMEQGTLAADGVSDHVLRALGDIVGVAWDELRSAGHTAGSLADRAEPDVAFARVAPPNADFAQEAAAPGAPVASHETGEDAELALVDALFTGGPGGGA